MIMEFVVTVETIRPLVIMTVAIWSPKTNIAEEIISNCITLAK